MGNRRVDPTGHYYFHTFEIGDKVRALVSFSVYRSPLYQDAIIQKGEIYTIFRHGYDWVELKEIVGVSFSSARFEYL